jgi:hypothetical protein
MSLIAKSLTAAEIAGASLCPCRNRAPAGFPKPAVNNADSPDLFPRSEAIKLKSRRDQISVTSPVKARQAPMHDIDGLRERHCVNRA